MQLLRTSLTIVCRMVNLQNGEIAIDERNIRNVGLRMLRSSLALVPQDTTLFFGTLRDNLSVIPRLLMRIVLKQGAEIHSGPAQTRN
jgi:ABC-type bacteriocin/lantibiotic exporter with double-glycine peptidase domain